MMLYLKVFDSYIVIQARSDSNFGASHTLLMYIDQLLTLTKKIQKGDSANCKVEP